MSNLVEACRCISVATIRVAEMPTWGRVSRPGAPMGSCRPNNQRVEIPTVCRDALNGYDQGSFHACSPIRLWFILIPKGLERVKDAQYDTCLIYIICVLRESS
jgi:hypothetical protein